MEIKLKVNQSVDNKVLEDKFTEFFADQTDDKHQDIVDAINDGTFLLPAIAKSSDIVELDGEKVLVDSANVNFMGCLNEAGEGFMPIFTSEEELLEFTNFSKVELEEGKVIVKILVTADLVWSMLLNDNGVCGTVINPLKTGWVIRTEQLVSVEE